MNAGKSVEVYANNLDPVYRDFLLALREMVETEGRTLRVSGIPAGMISYALRMQGHPYNADEIGRKLQEAELVVRDDAGFYLPTERGKRVIRELLGKREKLAVPHLVPPTF